MEAAASIFISFATNDRAYKAALVKSLAILRQEGKIVTWDHDELLPGEEKDKVIQQKMAEAKLILLLLSPDSLAETLTFEEIQWAMNHHQNTGGIVLPIILRPCDWDNTNLRELPFVLPQFGTPLVAAEDQDQALLFIADVLRFTIEKGLPNEEELELIANNIQKSSDLLIEAVELIGNGDTEKAFDKVKIFCEKKGAKAYNQLILIRGSQSRLRKRMSSGTIREADQEIQQANINARLLDLIDQLQSS